MIQREKTALTKIKETLREVRKMRGWSQEDAAHEVGVTLATWGRWERGDCVPDVPTLAKLGELFEVSFSI